MRTWNDFRLWARWSVVTLPLLAMSILPIPASGADVYGLTAGAPEMQSAGVLTFGPDGILFVGDAKGAAVFALKTGDATGDAAAVSVKIDGLNEKLADVVGGTPQAITVQDLAVNPLSGSMFLSVAGGSQAVAIVKVAADGTLSALDLKNIPFAKVDLKDAPADKVVGEGNRAKNNRSSSVTDLAFVDGFVLVSGLSSSASPSSIRSLAFPFREVTDGASIEIYHGAHGKVEDYAPIRTFVPFMVDGKPNVLAGYVCTPLVRFPVADLAPGEKLRGTTVAELGNRNQPLDMIAYKKGGRDYLLLSNSARGVMKIDTANLEANAGITEPVKGGGTAGQKFETIESLQGVVQLDKLNEEHAVVIVKTTAGDLNLETVPLP
ncbi:MAG: hypothetical protein R3C01_09030 [Planctomycetaceae bacterium]